MVEDFKKRKEEDDVDEGMTGILEEDDTKGASNVLDGKFVVREANSEGFMVDNAIDEFLENKLEEGEMDRDHSWETIDDGKGSYQGENVLDVSMEEERMENTVLEAEGDIVMGKKGVCVEDFVSSFEATVQKTALLNWKEVVIGGAGLKRLEEVQQCNKGEKDAECLGVAAEDCYRGVDGDEQNKRQDNGGRSLKVCRENNFDEHGGGFIVADGDMVHVDKAEVLECEVSLERALVGRILGCQVPFGFLHREQKKKWGKYGKVHLSLVGKNCFVCFSSTKKVRDVVLRG